MVERWSPKPEVAGSIPVAPALYIYFTLFENKEKMLKSSKVYRFYEEVKQEVLKIVWPQKKELISSTVVVIVTVCVFSVIFLLLDYGIHSVMHFLLTLGK